MNVRFQVLHHIFELRDVQRLRAVAKTNLIRRIVTALNRTLSVFLWSALRAGALEGQWICQISSAFIDLPEGAAYYPSPTEFSSL